MHYSTVCIGYRVIGSSDILDITVWITEINSSKDQSLYIVCSDALVIAIKHRESKGPVITDTNYRKLIYSETSVNCTSVILSHTDMLP